jgi:hypothetical protein
MLTLDDIDSHAPEGGKCKQSYIKLRYLFPAVCETVTRDNRENDHERQQSDRRNADVEIDIKNLFSDFL